MNFEQHHYVRYGTVVSNIKFFLLYHILVRIRHMIHTNTKRE